MFALLSTAGFIAFLKSAVFIVGYIQGSNLFPEPLSSEEEHECLVQMANGNDDARNILIERNLRLVAHVAKKYSSSNVDQDDLISIGTIGLIKGINSFNIDKGSKLSTYVSRCIDNEILMHLRSTKKLNSEVYLNEPIGKDKDDNVVTLQEVLENDERNISLSNAAMASGFKVMNVTISVSIFVLIFTGYMTVVPCFTIIGAYAIGQIVFIVRLWYLHKTM